MKKELMKALKEEKKSLKEYIKQYESGKDYYLADIGIQIEVIEDLEAQIKRLK